VNCIATTNDLNYVEIVVSGMFRFHRQHLRDQSNSDFVQVKYNHEFLI